jgi:hypothetical protein
METALDFCLEQRGWFPRPTGCGAPSDGGTAHHPIYQKLLWNKAAAQMVLPAEPARRDAFAENSQNTDKILLDTLDQSA